MTPLATWTSGCAAGTAPVALLTHGFSDNAASLADLAARLAPRYHVLACDLPSHGLSPQLATTEPDPIAACAAAIAATIPHGNQPVVGFGHSMGAAVLSLAAATHPGRFAALVLDDPAWLTPSQITAYRAAAPTTVKLFASYRADPAGALAHIQAHYPHWPKVELGGWLAGKYQVDEGFAGRGIVGLAAEVPPAGLPPTLVITGTGDDILIGPARAARLRQAGVDVAVIEGASHTCRRDAPAEFSRLASHFLHSKGLPCPV